VYSIHTGDRGVLDTTLCDKVCQRLAAGQWFSPGTPVSSINKTDSHDITEILLKVALNSITPHPVQKENQYIKQQVSFFKYHLRVDENELP
jgi:hypothetical protein